MSKPRAWKGCMPGLQAVIVAQYRSTLEGLGCYTAPHQRALGIKYGLGLRWSVWADRGLAHRLTDEDLWAEVAGRIKGGNTSWYWQEILNQLDSQLRLELDREKVRAQQAAQSARAALVDKTDVDQLPEDFRF